MSLTAMARKNALLERSTESNSAPSGTGIDLGDPAEYLTWHHDRSGTLCWERANEGCETPVVLHPSFACHTHKVVNTNVPLSENVFQCSLSNLQTCGENVSPERIRSEACLVREQVLAACGCSANCLSAPGAGLDAFKCVDGMMMSKIG